MALLQARARLVTRTYPILARSQQSRTFASTRTLRLPEKPAQKVATPSTRLDLPGTNNVSLTGNAAAKIHDFAAFDAYMELSPFNALAGRAFMIKIASQLQVASAEAGHHQMSRPERQKKETEMLRERIPDVKEFAIVDTHFTFFNIPNGPSYITTSTSDAMGQITWNIDKVVTDAETPAPKTNASLFMGFGFIFGKKLFYNEPGTQLGGQLKYMEGVLANAGSCEVAQNLTHPDLYEKKTYHDMHNAKGPNGEPSMNEQKAALIEPLKGSGLTFWPTYHSQSGSSAYGDTATGLKAGLKVVTLALSPTATVHASAHLLMREVAACITNVFPKNDLVPYTADFFSTLQAIKNSISETFATSGKPIPEPVWKGVPTTPVGYNSFLPRCGQFLRPGKEDVILPAAPGHPVYAHGIEYILQKRQKTYPVWAPTPRTKLQMLEDFHEDFLF